MRQPLHRRRLGSLNPDGGTTCTGNQYRCSSPTASRSPSRSTPGPAYPLPLRAPGPYTIQLPDDGIVPLCLNPYTGQLRHAWSASCPGGMRSVLIVSEIAPDAVDDRLFTTPVWPSPQRTGPGAARQR
ncbi:MAG: hypothetical protein R2849_19995 [Thermomicrobiales bacterium]